MAYKLDFNEIKEDGVKCLKQTFDFKGTATHREVINFAISNILVWVAISILSLFVIGVFLAPIAHVVLLIANVAVCFRFLRAVGEEPWLGLLGLCGPVVMILLALSLRNDK